MAATADPEEWVRGVSKEGGDDGVHDVPLESEPHVSDHAKTIQVFKGIMGDDAFADLVLIVGPSKQRLLAHKFVVMTRSKVLRSMLEGKWHESKAGEISVSRPLFAPLACPAGGLCAAPPARVKRHLVSASPFPRAAAA